MNKYQTLTIKMLFLFTLISILNANDVMEHIKQGDRFAKEFNNQNALKEYKLAVQADSSNCIAIWKMAEAYINLGEDAIRDKSKQLQYYYLAEKWARKTVVLCPETPNGHFFIAVSSGLLSFFEGTRSRINRSREVKAQAEETLRLDPEHHGAYHVLGRWNREMTELSWIQKTVAKIVYGGLPPGASLENAVKNFNKAIIISPNWINHHKELGITYMKMKNWKAASQEFQKVLELPVADHQDKFHKEECRRYLREIEHKL